MNEQSPLLSHAAYTAVSVFEHWNKTTEIPAVKLFFSITDKFRKTSNFDKILQKQKFLLTIQDHMII